MEAFAFACALLVGAILLMSGLLKFLDLPDFTDTVRKYALVPRGTAPAVALAVPLLEVLAAAPLLSGVAANAGGGLAAGLFAVFIVAVSINIRRGINLDCGCFGILWREKTGWPTVIRDGILLAAALVAALAGPGVALQDAVSDREDFADTLPILLVAAVLAGALLMTVAAFRANKGWAPPTPAPENLPPPGPA